VKTCFWMRTCVNCGGQGRLFIMKDLSNHSLYLHCEECECGWRDPEKTRDLESAFLTLDENFESEPATMTDIEEAGWRRYVGGESQL
jgi:hypothetical protein